MPARHRPAAVAVALAALTATLLSGCSSSAPPATATQVAEQAPAGADFRGLPVTTPFQRPQVTLTDTSGAPYDFARATRGRVTLVYLGYTHCTDVCPATMAAIARALEKVPSSVARQVTVAFVTTDPARDTPSVIKAWLGRFSPAFVGLTGTPSQLAATYHALGTEPKVVMGHDGKEEVEHGAEVYAFGTDNLARVAYDSDATVDDFAHDLPLLVAGEKPADVAPDLMVAGAVGRVGVVKAFTAYLQPVDADTARLHVSIVDDGKDSDRLVGADSPAAQQVVLRPAGGVTLPPLTPVTFATGAQQLLLEHLSRPLQRGALVDVTLHFASAGDMRLRIPVTGPNGLGS